MGNPVRIVFSIDDPNPAGFQAGKVKVAVTHPLVKREGFLLKTRLGVT